MSLVVKYIFCSILIFFAGFARARDIYVLILGDQSASNCHEHKYGAMPGVFQIGADGAERPAADPLEWSDCKGGSIWMPLAARLKQQPGVNRVVLMPIGVQNGKAEDWSKGVAAKRLKMALEVANARGVKFDYALWQQGRPDEKTGTGFYLSYLRTVLKKTTLNARMNKWLIAQSGTCLGIRLVQINGVQRQVGLQAMFNRFPGATDTGLSHQEQLADCTFSGLGQERMAQRWYNAILRSNILSQKLQKETLVYYFK